LSNKSVTVSLNSTGLIKGATINGGTINGTKIVTEELYAGISDGYEYKKQWRYSKLDPWTDSNETIILDESCEGKSPITIDDLN
jgi:hypothetical protein